MSVLTFSSKLHGRLRYCRTLSFGRRCIRLANRTPLISFTFDDFPRSALYSGGAILQEYGLAATYYTALGLMNKMGPVGQMFSQDDLHEVLARGHELGCHTFDHYHAWDTDPGTFESSVLRNRQALGRLLPGASFSTLSYPFSIPQPRTKQKVENYFLCCRGGGYRPLNFRTADLNFLNAFFLEKRRSDDIVKTLIDQNSKCGGWLIFATHDVAVNPSRFGCTPGFFRDVVRYAAASGATILPVAAALKVIIGEGSNRRELASDSCGSTGALGRGPEPGRDS
jgi:peptidoglycan/xylan/chitin deacetylase (PgdA/CDA1 family)